MLNVFEQFKSIQGESTFAGEPCSFIRLAGCNLKCSYCDTKYAINSASGQPKFINDIISEVEKHDCRLVEITGGEPMLQEETPLLCGRLIEKKHIVLVETNGSIFTGTLPEECIKIVDVKCPSSRMQNSFLKSNLDILRSTDQVKFVISDRTDFDWSLDFARKEHLAEKSIVIFSPVLNLLAPSELAQWILDSSAPVRLGLQLHVVIWGNDAKGR
jgi:7-carboxy-7-deazaguanine synthase